MSYKKKKEVQNPIPDLQGKATFQNKTSGARILTVDDDFLVTTLLTKLLIIEGYQVEAINDSSLTLETALSFAPDIILLDLMMPQPDGFRLCRMLRENSQFSSTPIMICTALDDDDSRSVAFGAGANDYITKPFHPDELSERIQDLLRGKELGLYN